MKTNNAIELAIKALECEYSIYYDNWYRATHTDYYAWSEEYIKAQERRMKEIKEAIDKLKEL